MRRSDSRIRGHHDSVLLDQVSEKVARGNRPVIDGTGLTEQPEVNRPARRAQRQSRLGDLVTRVL